MLYLLRKAAKGLPYYIIRERGVLSSLMCVLLLPPIPEGVIGIKPRGDTREKERTIFFFSLFGVGLSYSNPYGENYSAH